MIVAWFTRFGGRELQTFGDIDELAEQLLFLDDCDTSDFDKWGIFEYAEDCLTGHRFTDGEVDAAIESARAEAQRETEKLLSAEPAVYSTIYIADSRGFNHYYRAVTSWEQEAVVVTGIAGLGTRVIVKRAEKAGGDV